MSLDLTKKRGKPHEPSPSVQLPLPAGCPGHVKTASED